MALACLRLLRSESAIAGGFVIAAFGLYAAGACPTIYVGDSGELVAAVHTLGIPHPSGYPLYILLGKAWCLAVPVGSIAHRMSLFSAFAAAVAVGLVYLAGRALPVRRWSALVAAFVFAGSPSFWGEANVQRVYALNALFVALATWLALQWSALVKEGSKRRDRLFVGIAFVCGLGAANHTFLAVWGLAFGAFAVIAEPALLRRWRTLVTSIGGALAGLSIYAFLPWRSAREPRLDWGDPETFARLVAVVTRRDFWPRRWLAGPEDVLPIAGDFLASFVDELTPVAALLALAGLGIGLRRRGRPALLLALVIVANLAAMAAHGSRSDLFIWHRYYIPAYLSAALLAGLGLEGVGGLLELRALRSGNRPKRPSRVVFALALTGAVALIPVRFADFNRSNYRIAEDYSRTLLASLPPGAHLAASDDNVLFVLTYLQLVEGVRADIDLILQGMGGPLAPLRLDPDSEPLFFTHHPNWSSGELEPVPVGLVFQVVRVGSPAPPPLMKGKTELDGERDPGVPKDYLTQNLIGAFHFMLGLTWQRGYPRRALAQFAEAARAAPDNDVLFYNLGLVYERMGLPGEALGAFGRSHEINPRAIPGPQQALATTRIEVLRRRLGVTEQPD